MFQEELSMRTLKNGVSKKTNMADAAILNFEKALQFAHRQSNSHKIGD
jgi:hypothetical protein